MLVYRQCSIRVTLRSLTQRTGVCNICTAIACDILFYFSYQAILLKRRIMKEINTEIMINASIPYSIFNS